MDATWAGVNVGPSVPLAARVRKCARAVGRLSSPSTAVTTPSSAAGRYSVPVRYRCPACAIRTVVPNAADRSPSVPATLTRRDGACTEVTVTPGTVPSTDRTSATSVVAAPATPGAVRRSTSVSSSRVAGSAGPASGTAVRALPGRGTSDSCGMVRSLGSTKFKPHFFITPVCYVSSNPHVFQKSSHCFMRHNQAIADELRGPLFNWRSRRGRRPASRRCGRGSSCGAGPLPCR